MEEYKKFIENEIVFIMGKKAKKKILFDARLKEDIGMTSINMLMLISKIVEKYNIDLDEVDNDELLKIVTIGDVILFVNKTLNQ